MNACYAVSTQRQYEMNREWMKLMCNSRLCLLFWTISILEPAFRQSTNSHQQAMWILKAKFKKNEVRITNWRCFQPPTWSTVEAMETQMMTYHYYDNNTVIIHFPTWYYTLHPVVGCSLSGVLVCACVCGCVFGCVGVGVSEIGRASCRERV